VREAWIRKKLNKIVLTKDSEEFSGNNDNEFKNTNSFEKIVLVAGYYIHDEFFYYLKKINEKYIISKYSWGKELSVVLPENLIAELNDLDFFKFKKFCRKLEYKERIFDKK